MFRKEKKKDRSEDDLSLDIRADRRRYFRIEPDPGDPVFLSDDSRKYPVTDLAAGGLAFEAGPFSPGREYGGRLIFPDLASTGPLTLRAVREVRKNVIGAEIIEIDEEDRELIHAFVLHRQKEEMKKVRD